MTEVERQKSKSEKNVIVCVRECESMPLGECACECACVCECASMMVLEGEERRIRRKTF